MLRHRIESNTNLMKRTLLYCNLNFSFLTTCFLLSLSLQTVLQGSTFWRNNDVSRLGINMQIFLYIYDYVTTYILGKYLFQNTILVLCIVITNLCISCEGLFLFLNSCSFVDITTVLSKWFCPVLLTFLGKLHTEDELGMRSCCWFPCCIKSSALSPAGDSVSSAI